MSNIWAGLKSAIEWEILAGDSSATKNGRFFPNYYTDAYLLRQQGVNLAQDAPGGRAK